MVGACVSSCRSFGFSALSPSSFESCLGGARTFLARKKPCCLASTPYLHVCTVSTKLVASWLVRRTGCAPCSRGATGFQVGSECKAGKAKWYVNLYFFRSAKQITAKDESKEGHEYTVPSLIASHIYKGRQRICRPKGGVQCSLFDQLDAVLQFYQDS